MVNLDNIQIGNSYPVSIGNCPTNSEAIGIVVVSDILNNEGQAYRGYDYIRVRGDFYSSNNTKNHQVVRLINSESYLDVTKTYANKAMLNRFNRLYSQLHDEDYLYDNFLRTMINLNSLLNGMSNRFDLGEMNLNLLKKLNEATMLSESFGGDCSLILDNLSFTIEDVHELSE